MKTVGAETLNLRNIHFLLEVCHQSKNVCWTHDVQVLFEINFKTTSHLFQMITVDVCVCEYLALHSPTLPLCTVISL